MVGTPTLIQEVAAKITQRITLHGINCSKVAGAKFPEWEYTQKTLEKQGLLCMLEGRQTPIDPGAHPCGDAHAAPATYPTFSIPSSLFFAVRQPGTL